MSANPSERCDGRRLAQSLADASSWLDAQATTVNALNVFPVPDGDTGTNMSLTLRAAAREALACTETGVGAVAQSAAHGALLGARGNSGVIFSQYLRGIARHFGKADLVSPTDLAQALLHGSSTAYKAVIRPVEGTILTVSRGAAQAAVARAEKDATFADVLEAALDGARETLGRTPDMLPVLKQAGVVDAGGFGLAVILEGLLRHFRGESVAYDARAVSPEAVLTLPAVDMQEDGYGYCTEFLLKSPTVSLEKIQQRIVSLGDSALVVGDGDLVRVHVHTPNPGAVLEYACSIGSLHRIKIDNMQEQHDHIHVAPPRPSSTQNKNGLVADTAKLPSKVEPASGAPPNHQVDVKSRSAMVAVAAGAGFSSLLQSLGVSVVVPGGQTMNPSTEELLRAVHAAGAEQVLLLPNNSNILMAARQVPSLANRDAAIVPTRDMAQGIAAALAFQPESDLETNRKRMELALSSVRTGEITTAVRDATIGEFEIQSGQLIALAGGNVVASGGTMIEIALDLASRLGADEAELVTLYHGHGTDGEAAELLGKALTDQFPNVDVEIHDGGQPLYHFLISVE